MGRKLIEKFALPGLGAVVAASAALAAGAGDVDGDGAYGDQLTMLEADTYAAHASAMFDRADINADGSIDKDEYEALSIVSAELARLNGFVAIEVEGDFKTVALPTSEKLSLTSTERARLGAVSSRIFYRAAGSDELIQKNEFVTLELERFLSADRNQNGILSERELSALVAQSAGLTTASA